MKNRRLSGILPFVILGFGVSACDTQFGQSIANFDFDFRNNAGALDTSDAARGAAEKRPKPDKRGLISYPSYQVAVAQRGDSVSDVASRIGYDATELAKFNGLKPDDRLNTGEVLALPRPVPAAPSTARSGGRDIEAIATTAIDNAPSGRQGRQSDIARATPSAPLDGPEPVRHQVQRGETAFSVARLYDVSPKALAEWNGLGPDLAVREDQFLLIPLVRKAKEPEKQEDTRVASTTLPGGETSTPQPPSASKPLPDPEPPKVEPKPVNTAAAASTGRLTRPVAGEVIRPYKKRENEGIDISAPAGTPVKAADAGTVAAITRDTDQIPILVLRHANGLLTVYANISDVDVKKGDKVSRGQTIAKVRSGNPSFLHFEVRQGFESVDPDKFLN